MEVDLVNQSCPASSNRRDAEIGSIVMSQWQEFLNSGTLTTYMEKESHEKSLFMRKFQRRWFVLNAAELSLKYYKERGGEQKGEYLFSPENFSMKCGTLSPDGKFEYKTQMILRGSSRGLISDLNLVFYDDITFNLWIWALRRMIYGDSGTIQVLQSVRERFSEFRESCARMGELLREKQIIENTVKEAIASGAIDQLDDSLRSNESVIKMLEDHALRESDPIAWKEVSEQRLKALETSQRPMQLICIRKTSNYHRIAGEIINHLLSTFDNYAINVAHHQLEVLAHIRTVITELTGLHLFDRELDDFELSFLKTIMSFFEPDESALSMYYTAYHRRDTNNGRRRFHEEMPRLNSAAAHWGGAMIRYERAYNIL